MHDPVHSVPRQIWRRGGVSEGQRAVPEEAPVALSYNGGTYAVMMATPRDLEDFAFGFSLSEGIVSSAAEIRSLDVVELDDGVELRMWLRRSQGRSAQRPPPPYRRPDRLRAVRRRVDRRSIAAGGDRQFRRRASHRRRSWRRCRRCRRCSNSTSKPARCMPRRFGRRQRGIAALREDVGRHNALDKLAGALARDKIATADGMVLLTSRVSVEMVQKTATIGAPLIVSVSAPTALAIRMAEAAGITLAAIARADGFEVFTHPGRIALGEAADVA